MKRRVFILTGCLLLPGLAPAAEPGLEQRLERLERILKNQSLSDVILQLQQLQQEVQQLRGELELQKYTLDAQNKRQRELYLDVDRRLHRVEAGGQSAPVVDPSVPGQPATTSGAAAPAGSPPRRYVL